jgi:hypothetical protein
MGVETNYQVLYVDGDIPTTPIRLGQLVMDGTVLKRCTALGPPPVYTAVAGGGAPDTAQYLTLATDAGLTNERILTAGTGIAFVDGGPGGALTISATGGTTTVDDIGSVVLLRGNGLNAATQVADRSGQGRRFLFVGGAQVSTAQSKFGGSSMRVRDNSTNSCITLPAVTDFDVSAASTNWTAEIWVRTSNPSASTGLVVGLTRPATSIRPWALDVSGNAFRFQCTDAAGTTVVSITDPSTLTDDTWYFVAMTRNGSTFTLWVNGVSVGTAVYASTLAPLTSANITFGTDLTTGTTTSIFYVQDFRYTVGTARYTAGFSVPTTFLPSPWG